MESPYWYQDLLYTGNYSGEDGIFAWELADLDDDEQNELIVFFRQSDVHDYTDESGCYLKDAHGWRFHSLSMNTGTAMYCKRRKGIFAGSTGQQMKVCFIGRFS